MALGPIVVELDSLRWKKPARDGVAEKNMVDTQMASLRTMFFFQNQWILGFSHRCQGDLSGDVQNQWIWGYPTTSIFRTRTTPGTTSSASSKASTCRASCEGLPSTWRRKNFSADMVLWNSTNIDIFRNQMRILNGDL